MVRFSSTSLSRQRGFSPAALASLTFSIILLSFYYYVDSAFRLFHSTRTTNKLRRYQTCATNNPTGLLNHSSDVISSLADSWLMNIDQHLKKSTEPDMIKWSHARFFPFEEMAPCKHKLCIGGPCELDGSKIMCEAEELGSCGCVVYSIGSNDDWSFEEDILKQTPCEVHTFDCTGDVSRFHVPATKRLTFHHVCLGSSPVSAPLTCKGREICGRVMTLFQIQKMLGHHRIDLLKMDVEGHEWPIFKSWRAMMEQKHGIGDEIVFPTQVLLEVHYRTKFKGLWFPGQTSKNQDWKSAKDIVEFQAQLLRMGYAVAVREDNPLCRHCTELTLVRHRCPIASDHVRYDQ